MFIINYRKIFFILSATTIALSFYAVIAKGLHYSIDFSGGSIMEVSYTPVSGAELSDKNRPDIETIKASLDNAGFSDARIQMAGERGVMIKTRALLGSESQKLSQALSSVSGFTMEEKRSSSIGPTIGKELRSKALLAIVMVILGIVLFIAYIFRRVSKPVASWKYGVVTAMTLLHDIIVPAGIFIWLGKEIDTLFVVALLSVMGISVHDTIVVFDRIRENLKIKLSNDFATTVGKSLEQTFSRSINTSLTVMFVLATLYFFGPASTKDFSMILWIGIFVGTYSSIFIASPLLVVLEKWQSR